MIKLSDHAYVLQRTSRASQATQKIPFLLFKRVHGMLKEVDSYSGVPERVNSLSSSSRIEYDFGDAVKDHC